MPFRIIKADINSITDEAIIVPYDADIVYGDEKGPHVTRFKKAKDPICSESGETFFIPPFIEVSGVEGKKQYIIPRNEQGGCRGGDLPESPVKSYENALAIAHKLMAKKVSVSLTWSEKNSNHVGKELHDAISAARNFLDDHEMDISIAVPNDIDILLSRESEKLISYIKAQIPENILFSIDYDELPGRKEILAGHISGKFNTKLLELIDERNLKDSDVYRKARVSRSVFSKIRCNEKYLPKKKTIICLALALELDLEETKDLLERAGEGLIKYFEFDSAIKYFIENKFYDLDWIALVLMTNNIDNLFEDE